MAYITYTDIETFLNITLTTEGRAVVNGIIPALEKYAEKYCGRIWSYGSSTDITEIFDGGTDTFFVANPPISSVQSVNVDGTAEQAADIYNYGSYVKLASSAGSGNRNVTIVYRTSVNTVPDDIKHALIQWVSQVFKAHDDGGKVASRVSMGPMSAEYKVNDGVPEFVERVLSLHRIIPI